MSNESLEFLLKEQERLTAELAVVNLKLSRFGLLGRAATNPTEITPALDFPNSIIDSLRNSVRPMPNKKK